MKTIETLYKEIMESDELKKVFVQAVQDKQVEAFLKTNDCNATTADIEKFLAEQQSKEGAISDAELGNASGGCNGAAVGISITSLGINCLALGIYSAKNGGNSDEYVLCNDVI